MRTLCVIEGKTTVAPLPISARLCKCLFGRGIFAAAAILTSLVTGLPNAAAATQDASAFIESLGKEVLQTLQATEVASIERGKKFRALFAAKFAVDEMGRFAIGQYWRTIDENQKSEYLAAFKDYVAMIYADKFATYSGERFKVLEERDDTSDSRLVSSEIVEPGGKRIALAFRVTGQQGDFKIIDVKVEGVSLLVTKRSEFTSMIQRNGFAAFLGDLKRVGRPS